MLERNKKKLTFGLVAVLVVVIVVVAGVAIGLNVGRGSNDGGDDGTGAIVRFEMNPEGYGDNPAGSTLVAIFASRIDDELAKDATYNYDDAVSDYEIAYGSVSGEMRLELAYVYAEFVFRETKNIEEVKSILKRVEEDALKDNDNIVKYYTILSRMCTDVGLDDEADNYIKKREELAPPRAVPEEIMEKVR